MSIFKSLSESISGVGYSSSGTDSFPRLSMTECVGEFGVYLEEAIGINEAASNHELMSSVEAILSESVDIETLDENMWESFKTRVKQIFDSIVKFINSIVAKVNDFIAKHTSNLGYITKYEAEMKKKELSGFEFEGYEYNTDMSKFVMGGFDVDDIIVDGAKASVSSEKAKGLEFGMDMIKSKDFSPSNGWASDDSENSNKTSWKDAKEAIAEINSGPDSFKSAIYKKITALDVSDPKQLQERLATVARGANKVKINVNVGTLIARMKDYKTFLTIKEGYKKLTDDVNKARTDLQKAIDEASKKSKAAVKDNKEDSKKLSNLLGEFNSFAKGYLSLYTKSIACINTVRGAVLTLAKDQRKQDLELAKKIIAYKNEPKGESYDDFDITIYED